MNQGSVIHRCNLSKVYSFSYAVMFVRTLFYK